ncbi:class I SAM-dependent methyltransferase [uncultured Desulfobacter sp.]|uniref:class I SAM-dependent methyltransferase n=1 Tax=uncultured Desulfobacter sp. TaxID=240139 RepID=UPI002AA7CCDC|nr:class I SAM-dependent methyltransferase [uncultured Desulfobacter sp.]
MMKEYHWINTKDLNLPSGQKIILFGAGKGSEDFFSFNKNTGLKSHVTAIIDNDKSMWGNTLFNVPIICPADLSKFKWDKIIVTSVSGREPIAAQLNEMGFSNPEDYLLIGKFPSNGQKNFSILCESLPENYCFSNKACLHIGPGGNFDFETILFQRQAHVTAIDKYDFGMDGKPEILQKINFLFPADIEAMPLEENSFDLVASFAVLEHTRCPEKALSEINRVLKPGGIAVQTIVTRDHRSFSSLNGYTPFSYRKYSDSEWDFISGQKFYQNRLMPCQWLDLARKTGLGILRYETLSKETITPEMKNDFHVDFDNFTIDKLEEVDCLLVASK